MLGRDPYPNSPVDEAIMAVLRGHRLEQPELCPENMFVMQSDTERLWICK